MRAALLSLFFLPALCFAQSLKISWQDNSDNEDGFSVEAMQGEDWQEIARTAPDSNELLVDVSQYDAFRVRAFNEWGFSGYSNELSKDLPASPGDSLRIKSVTEESTTTSVTKTTKTTEYQL